MNTVIINLLEKEGYSCFGTLLDGKSNNTLGMCFIKNNIIYFYKECGDEIPYEELFEIRNSDLIILEYSKIEKRYIISGDYVCEESRKDWNKKITRCSYVVNVKNGCFSTLQEYSSFRFPLAIEYLKNSLLVYSSATHENNIDSSTLLISKSNGYLYSFKENEESNLEVAAFYCKWNGWCIVDSKEYQKNNVYVSFNVDILHVPEKSLLWKVPNNGNIWVISNIVNECADMRGFYAVSLETSVICRLYEHCISWYNINVSNAYNFLWIHSNDLLIMISEKWNDNYCEMSIRAKLTQHYNNLVVLSEDYAVFKDSLGPIYYIYELKNLWNIHDEYVYPTYESSEDYNTNYARIGHNLKGLLSLKTGKIVIPQMYNEIRFWETGGKVYSVVGINSKSNDNPYITTYEGLYIDDCIFIPPFCKNIERVTTYDSNYNINYKDYEGFIMYTGYNDSLGLYFKDKLLADDNVTHISMFKPGYMIVVKNDERTLYHQGDMLFSAKCREIKKFKHDLLLLVGDNNQCALITYDGDIKLSMGEHDLSYDLYFDGTENTSLIIDKGRNVYDSRNMRSFIPTSLKFLDVSVRYNNYCERNTLCLACYEDKSDSIVFLDQDGNKLNSTVVTYEPIGQVRVVFNPIIIYGLLTDEEAKTYNYENGYEYEIFDINLKKFITQEVFCQGYEIVENENSQAIIRKKEVKVLCDDNDEAYNSTTHLPDNVGDWSFADAELEDFRDNYDY